MLRTGKYGVDIGNGVRMYPGSQLFRVIRQPFPCQQIRFASDGTVYTAVCIEAKLCQFFDILFQPFFVYPKLHTHHPLSFAAAVFLL